MGHLQSNFWALGFMKVKAQPPLTWCHCVATTLNIDFCRRALFPLHCLHRFPFCANIFPA